MNKLSGSDVFYRPINWDDYKLFYPDMALSTTVRGLAFVKDDVVCGIAGVQYMFGYFKVFSNIKDDIIVPKQTIWRAAKVIMEIVDSMKCDVYATPDCNIARAPFFLERLGFKDIGNSYKRSYVF